MGVKYLSLLALLSLHSLGAHCASEAVPPEQEEQVDSPSSSPKLAVQASVSFPQSEIFGIKLVNGHTTQSVLSIANNEADPITVSVVGGSLWTTMPGAVPMNVRNLTAVKYNVEIPAGQKESLTYAFATELQPQDLRLQLAALVADNEGTAYTLQLYNETVSVVEPETSIFDPQM